MSDIERLRDLLMDLGNMPDELAGRLAYDAGWNDAVRQAQSALLARVEAAPPPLDGLDVERLSVAMNRATVYGKGTAEEVAREYAALREGETK